MRNLSAEGETRVYENNGEWELIRIPVEIIRREELHVAIQQVSYKVILHRMSSYYVSYLLAPIMMMSALTCMIFALPAESGEKASFGVTLFLSQIVFSVVVQGYMPVQASTMPFLSELLEFSY
mgnify:CR=1 FL=1